MRHIKVALPTYLRLARLKARAGGSLRDGRDCRAKFCRGAAKGAASSDSASAGYGGRRDRYPNGQRASGSSPELRARKAGRRRAGYPLPITAGEEVRIWYGGLLAKSGAVDVYLHMGIGPGAWQQVRDVRMKKESAGIFSCIIQAPAQGGRLEFCFHDGAAIGITSRGVTGISQFITA